MRQGDAEHAHDGTLNNVSVGDSVVGDDAGFAESDTAFSDHFGCIEMIHDRLVVEYRPEKDEQQTDDKDGNDRKNDRLRNSYFADENCPSETGSPDNGNYHHGINGKVRLVFQGRFKIFTK